MNLIICSKDGVYRVEGAKIDHTPINYEIFAKKNKLFPRFGKMDFY